MTSYSIDRTCQPSAREGMMGCQAMCVSALGMQHCML